MATMQDILDLARLDLNDADKVRNTDADMLVFANDGIAKVKVMRPDLNWGNYATSYADLTVSDPFPFAIEYRPAIANYIVMRCEGADDEFAIQQRAIQALKVFMSDLGLG